MESLSLLTLQAHLLCIFLHSKGTFLFLCLLKYKVHLDRNFCFAYCSCCTYKNIWYTLCPINTWIYEFLTSYIAGKMSDLWWEWITFDRLFILILRPMQMSSMNEVKWICFRKKLLQGFSLIWGFPGCSDSRESAYNAGDLGLIPRLERSPGEGNATSSSVLPWRSIYHKTYLESHTLYYAFMLSL